MKTRSLNHRVDSGELEVEKSRCKLTSDVAHFATVRCLSRSSTKLTNLDLDMTSLWRHRCHVSSRYRTHVTQRGDWHEHCRHCSLLRRSPRPPACITDHPDWRLWDIVTELSVRRSITLIAAMLHH